MFNRGLNEHMRECLEARKEASRRFDDFARTVEAGFGEARRKIDERHEQNQKANTETRAAVQALDDKTQKSFSKLYGGLWRVVLAVLGALASSYLLQHGFTAPGLVH
jgi:transposase